jgi:hypothetical protein
MGGDFTEADGRQLAIDMLRDLADEWEASDELLEGVPDDEITETILRRDPAVLRRYLKVMRARRCAALERGFLAVLADMLGSNVAEDPGRLQFYECTLGTRRGA